MMVIVIMMMMMIDNQISPIQWGGGINILAPDDPILSMSDVMILIVTEIIAMILIMLMFIIIINNWSLSIIL